MAANRSKAHSRRGRRAESLMAQKPKPLGWNTTDEDEIALRRWRGETEDMQFKPLESAYPYFGTFSVQSQSSSPSSSYRVEIRHLSAPINSCDCPDYQYNGLGVCKHIEKVLFILRQKPRRFAQAKVEGSPRVEIYCDKRDQHNHLCVQWPASLSKRASERRLLGGFFTDDGQLLEDPLITWSQLRQALAGGKPALLKTIRISSQIEPFLQEQRRSHVKKQNHSRFWQDVENGQRSLEMLKLPLYPYQQEGMLHLALNERALLSDEMGLGKTIQAIAACELLRRTQGIKTVLVVATASLKTEWEEQIKQCVDLPFLIVRGDRADRLKQYQQSTFFYLTNYEQVVIDAADIQRLIAPDVIILDEAQRIKNWQTKTASAIKTLESRYAFVLTGTPLENRIDDIYSIVQFLDPSLFGPLFRFNRDFYELNDKGQPVAYKNLDQLHQRLQPILLRRRKQDVEKELPPCSTQEYFVTMTDEQISRYREYEEKVSRLAKIGERRPLSPEEFKRLQQYLSCMRMLCDTPYILDEACRDCPKLIELEVILEELMVDPAVKIIIFSEWARMLQLVRELAQKMGLGVAWHTGSVPQMKRRQEINRFKQDPHCRLFLSTDSGSVGLNLQAANVVINLDLPWNPAKLAQRIARAWRKHQHRHVQVINLIADCTIEHRMLGLLNQKQTLAQGVLHGDNDLSRMELPSGRKAFMERLSELLQKPATEPIPSKSNPWRELSSSVSYLAIREKDDQPATVLAVSEQDSSTYREQIQSVVKACYPQQTPHLELLDRRTFDAIQRLTQAGLLTLHPQLRTLYESSGQTESTLSETKIPLQWLTTARQKHQLAERSLRLAEVLVKGEFYPEALSPLRETIELLFTAAAWLEGMGDQLKAEESFPIANIEQLITQQTLPGSLLLITFLRDHSAIAGDQHIQMILKNSQTLWQWVKSRLKENL